MAVLLISLFIRNSIAALVNLKPNLDDSLMVLSSCNTNSSKLSVGKNLACSYF